MQEELAERAYRLGADAVAWEAAHPQPAEEACDFCAKVKPGSYYFDQEVGHVVFLCGGCAPALFGQLGPARGFEPVYQALADELGVLITQAAPVAVDDAGSF